MIQTSACLVVARGTSDPQAHRLQHPDSGLSGVLVVSLCLDQAGRHRTRQSRPCDVRPTTQSAILKAVAAVMFALPPRTTSRSHLSALAYLETERHLLLALKQPVASRRDGRTWRTVMMMQEMDGIEVLQILCSRLMDVVLGSDVTLLLDCYQRMKRGKKIGYSSIPSVNSLVRIRFRQHCWSQARGHSHLLRVREEVPVLSQDDTQYLWNGGEVSPLNVFESGQLPYQ